MNLRKRNGGAAAEPSEPVAPKAPAKKKAENGKAAAKTKKPKENVEPEETAESEYFKEPEKNGGGVVVEDLSADEGEVKMKNSKKKKSPLKGKLLQKKDKEAAASKSSSKKKAPVVHPGPVLSAEDAIENMLKMEMMGAKGSNDDDDEAMSDSDDSDDSGSDRGANKRRDNDEDEDDFEEVEMEVDHASLVPKITKESLQITVDNKKSKKQVDKAAQLERMRKAIQKKYRIIVHKLHLHCWLAHGFYLNRLCLVPLTRAVVLSVQTTLKLNSDFKLAKLDRKKLVSVLEACRSAFGLSDAKPTFEGQASAAVTCQSLMKAVQDLRCASYLEYLLVVLVILRNLNVKVRLCVCLDVVSLKDETTSSRAATKGATKKKARSKKQQELSSSEDEDEEEPEEKKPKYSKKVAVKSEPQAKMSRHSSKAALEKLKKQEQSDSDGDVDSDERDFKDIKKKRTSMTAASSLSKKVKKEEDDQDFKPDLVKESLSDDEPVVKPKDEVEPDPNNNVIEVQKLNKRVVKNNRILSTTDEDMSINCPKDQDRSYWLEVYLEHDKRWVCAEPVSLVVDEPEYFEKRYDDQVLYVCAFDEANRLKDVTKRYSSNFLTTGRLLHISHIDDKKLWWETIMFKFLPLDAELDMQEEKELKQMLLSKELPSGLSEFKGHPLYILKRHLLKFQSIYPQHPNPVGHFREEPVYSRDNLVTLHSKQTWLKYARVIKPGQDAYKIVKGRLKASEYKAGRRDNPDLELYGFWQTKEYEPPRAYGGKVPRNEFGNVELFLPNMLPRGCVHLRFPNLNRICRKLNIDCAAAVVGFDAHGGFSHAVCDGWVVCEEFRETVEAAAEEEERRANLKLIQMREEKILNNWQRLVRGVQIREKLRLKYETFGSKGAEPQKTTKAAKPQSETKQEEAMRRQIEYPLEDFKSKKSIEMQAMNEDTCDNVQISAKLLLTKGRGRAKPAPKPRQALAKKGAKKQPAYEDETAEERQYPKRKTRNKKPIVDENDDEEIEVENDDDRDKNFSGSEAASSESEEIEEEADEDFDSSSSKKPKKRLSRPKQQAAPKRKKLSIEPDVPATTHSPAPPVTNQTDDLNLSEDDSD